MTGNTVKYFSVVEVFKFEVRVWNQQLIIVLIVSHVLLFSVKLSNGRKHCFFALIALQLLPGKNVKTGTGGHITVYCALSTKL